MQFRIFVIVCLCLGFSAVTSAQTVKSIRITDLEKMIATSRTPLVINFWATYCKPCIAEMPSFEKMAGKYKNRGLTVLFVSLDMQDDFPGKVDSFIVKRNVRNKVLWLNETDADYFCPKVDPKWSGAIPATLFINRAKKYRHFLEEELSEEELEKEIMAIL